MLRSKPQHGREAYCGNGEIISFENSMGLLFRTVSPTLVTGAPLQYRNRITLVQFMSIELQSQIGEILDTGVDRNCEVQDNL